MTPAWRRATRRKTIAQLHRKREFLVERRKKLPPDGLAEFDASFEKFEETVKKVEDVHRELCEAEYEIN